LRRDAGIVDERIELAVAELRAHLLDAGGERVDVREVDLYVTFLPAFPRAVFGEGMARNGQHPPARGAETLHCRVADPAARAGQKQGLATFARHARILARPRRRSTSIAAKSSRDSPTMRQAAARIEGFMSSRMPLNIS